MPDHAKPASRRTTKRKRGHVRTPRPTAQRPRATDGDKPRPKSPDYPERPPRSPDELHAWLAETLGIKFPRRALNEGHAAPFEYLCHTFFEGRPSWVDGDPDAQGPSPDELASTPIDCVVWANRGGGKTFLVAVATMLDLVFKPGIQIRILGGSLEQAARMHEHLRNLFAIDALAGYVDGRITDRRIRLTNRSSAELLAQSQVSVRGTRVQKLRCDEVELFDPMVWEAAQLTTRGRRCGPLWVRGGIECLSTMHVPHGIMARLVEGAAQGRRRIFKWGLIDVLGHCGEEHRCHARPGVPAESATEPSDSLVSLPVLLPALSTAEKDCPLLPECAGRAKRLGSGHIAIEDALAQKARVGLATWESEMLCLRPRRSGCVLPEFDGAVHIVKELPWGEGQPAYWVGGMDFGYRASVVLWAGVDAAGNVCIVDERCVENEILDEHIRAIRAGLGRPWPALAWIGVDPAGSSRNDQTGEGSAQVLIAAGLPVRYRRMSVDLGLSLIRARLKPADGPARLFVHERCRHLIESLEKYHYHQDRPESLVPVKDGHDHAVDALRYLMVNLDRPYLTRQGVYLE